MPDTVHHLTARDMAAADLLTAAINAEPIEARHGDAYAVLRDLGFAADLGVAWTLDLGNGTTIILSGVDEYGEPGEVSTDGRAYVSLLRDPDDYDTLVEFVDCETFEAALETVERMVGAA